MVGRACLALGLPVALFLAGCSGAPDETSQSPSAEPRFLFSPINRNGELDVVPSTAPPRDKSPSCQVFVTNEPMRILDLIADVSWEPTSERTTELRLRLEGPDGAPASEVQGRSPLNATVDDFDLETRGEFRVLISLIGNEAGDALLEPQTANFAIGFVERRPETAPQDSDARWDSRTKCPE